MNSSTKKKLIILAIAAFAITLIALLIIRPQSEVEPDAPAVSAQTTRYQVSGCEAQLISDAGAAEGRAIAYTDSPESGVTAKVIEVPEGKNSLAVSCDVLSLSREPIDFLEGASATISVSGTRVPTTAYAENQSHLDANNYPTKSTYGAVIYRGETTKLWFIGFVDSTVAAGSDTLTLDYTILGASHQLNIRDILTIY